MRVLMTADTVGGVWTYALDLFRGLAGRGVETALATMGPPAEAAPFPLFQSEFKLEWMENPWEDVARAGDWLLDLERRLSPDVIHLNGFAHGALEWRAPVVVVGHSCVLSWWRAVHHEDAPAAWDLYRERVAGGLRAADLVVAPSSAMLAALKSCYGDLPRSAVIHNGRDPAFFTPVEKEPMVLSAGRLWDEAKNIAAVAALADRLPWPVYVAGELNDARQPSGCRVLGRLAPEELRCWMARAAIYVLPARYEPFGLSILEAALSGCALILGDIPSLRELWLDAALFVNPDDSRALHSALMRLIGGERGYWADRARERAREFSSERMTAAYMSVYRDLISR